MPRPPLTVLRVTSRPPNVLISALGPPSVHVTPDPLTSTGRSVRPTSAPATSLPSAVAPTSTQSGAALRDDGASLGREGGRDRDVRDAGRHQDRHAMRGHLRGGRAGPRPREQRAAAPDRRRRASSRARVASSSVRRVGAPPAISPIDQDAGHQMSLRAAEELHHLGDGLIRRARARSSRRPAREAAPHRSPGWSPPHRPRSRHRAPGPPGTRSAISLVRAPMMPRSDGYRGSPSSWVPMTTAGVDASSTSWPVGLIRCTRTRPSPAGCTSDGIGQVRQAESSGQRGAHDAARPVGGIRAGEHQVERQPA